MTDIRSLGSDSIVAMGNLARVQRVLAKARRGEQVILGAIGGSITQGASASVAAKAYASRFADGWREMFPSAAIRMINAGIGATASNYGALRVQRDLLDQRPDLVVVEYAVNDGEDPNYPWQYEGVLRQILSAPWKPAVILLFLMNDKGDNRQAEQARVGAHYGLPMISYRDAVWPEVKAGRLAWLEIATDEVHPNDRGHEIIADLLLSSMRRAQAGLPAENRIPAPEPVPSPLHTDLYQQVCLKEAPELVPSSNTGWIFDSGNRCWSSRSPGAVIEFEVEGRAVIVSHWKLNGGFGRATVRVDGQAPVVMDGWFDQTWGGYRRTLETGYDLPPGVHRVRFELLNEKAEGSTGHEFRIMAIGAAGVAPVIRSSQAELLDLSFGKGAVACRSFMGFGAEWDANVTRLTDTARTLTDADWALVEKRMKWMRLPLVRMWMQAKWCYRGGGRYEMESPEMQLVCRHLALCQKLGIDVILTEWGCERADLRAPDAKDYSDPLCAEMIGTYLDHFINRKGFACIKYFVLGNEPNLEFADTGGYARWRRGAEQLHAELVRRGLDKRIGLAGSDESDNQDWHRKAVDDLHGIFSAYDIHRYARHIPPNEMEVTTGRLFELVQAEWQYALARDPDAKRKPLIIGEAGIMHGGFTAGYNPCHLEFLYGLKMADYAAQVTAAGAWAVSAWMLDDSSHDGDFNWGMWKNKEYGFGLKPWFYPWALLCRLVPAGSTLYRPACPVAGVDERKASRFFRLCGVSPTPDVRAMAARFRKSKGHGWTVWLVNRGAEPVTAKLSVFDAARGPVAHYLFSADEAPADADGFPIPKLAADDSLADGVVVTCPAKSAYFVTTEAG